MLFNALNQHQPNNSNNMVSMPPCGNQNMDTSYSSFAQHIPKSQDSFTCRRCGIGGCDLRVLDCGCYLHTRCTPVSDKSPMAGCPVCNTPSRILLLLPMSFYEIDAAKAAAANTTPSSKRGKKRKNATIARLNPVNSTTEENGGESGDLRTGRWTAEETAYCDKLIEKFELGHLPIDDGIKLNDFLSNMLKSKQSRLTKKMKNARLSAKTYKRTEGYIPQIEEARNFSHLESSFFASIQCDMERSEIKFHMQKEWRELFSTYCVAVGQKLDADSWLSSVEEMDRRASQAKDAARMTRRKIMMGYALSQDSLNPESGVFIERSTSTETAKSNGLGHGHASTGSLTGLASRDNGQRGRNGQQPWRDYSSPFVGKIIQYIERHNIPFEHIDTWVPSFVPNQGAPSNDSGPDQKCRLCFAGCATTETQIPGDGSRPVPLTNQDQFDLLSFGEYSQKFSFDVGCGLPGRVYSSGISSWEQGVANAPSRQFERCGGASQWGIKTVLGIPIPSPNVGRIVVLLYSRHDRLRDAEMVRRITEEFSKLMPTPKWKLVVDIGEAPPPTTSNTANGVDPRIQELLRILNTHIPTHKDSPYAPYLPGFTSLRLLLLRHNNEATDNDILSTVLESYSSYLASGRGEGEISWMIARDYMLLAQTMNPSASSSSSSALQHHLPPPMPPAQIHHAAAPVPNSAATGLSLMQQSIQQQHTNSGILQHSMSLLPSTQQHQQQKDLPQQHRLLAAAQHMQQGQIHQHQHSLYATAPEPSPTGHLNMRVPIHMAPPPSQARASDLCYSMNSNNLSSQNALDQSNKSPQGFSVPAQDSSTNHA